MQRCRYVKYSCASLHGEWGGWGVSGGGCGELVKGGVGVGGGA